MATHIHIHTNDRTIRTPDSRHQESALQRIESLCNDIRQGLKRGDEDFVHNNFVNIANLAKTAATQ